MITILTPSFPPISEFGGPNKSLAGVCNLFENSEIPYRVIAQSKRKTQEPIPNVNPNIRFKDRIRVGELIGEFKEAEVIWINTLYNYSFSMLPLLALFFTPKRKVLISPRGELLKGALNLKKYIYLRFFKWGLQLAGHEYFVHYANPYEAEKSYGILKKYPKLIFNNVISGAISNEEHTGSIDDKFVLGYFGRVSPIKNVEFLLELLLSLPDKVVLQIHGSIIESRYVGNLRQQVEKLGLSDRVAFFDSYNSANFAERAAGVDVVLIPSKSESFCHVFFEAIESRKLVLASTGLPWTPANELVPSTLLDLEVELWKDRILELMQYDEPTYREQQNKLVDYYNSVFNTTNADTLKGINKILQ